MTVHPLAAFLETLRPTYHRCRIKALDGRRIASASFTDAMKEIQNTPVLLLTEADIARLDPDSQDWARKAQAQHARKLACPGHESVSTGTWADNRRGWHPAKCKHCGTDMSVDSGD